MPQVGLGCGHKKQLRNTLSAFDCLVLGRRIEQGNDNLTTVVGVDNPYPLTDHEPFFGPQSAAGKNKSGVTGFIDLQRDTSRNRLPLPRCKIKHRFSNTGPKIQPDSLGGSISQREVLPQIVEELNIHINLICHENFLFRKKFGCHDAALQ